MPNPVYTYVLDIYDLVWLGFIAYQRCGLFNAKLSLYTYIKYIGFPLVKFYHISTIVDYLMSNPIDVDVLNIYDLVYLGFMAYQLLYVILCQIPCILIY